MSTDNPNKLRSVRMTDFMWETLADLAASNHRTIGEEIRSICHDALIDAGYEFDEQRATRTTAGSFRKEAAA